MPAQEVLHKQWCLFDQGDGDIDFEAEVTKIIGGVDEVLSAPVSSDVIGLRTLDVEEDR